MVILIKQHRVVSHWWIDDMLVLVYDVAVWRVGTGMWCSSEAAAGIWSWIIRVNELTPLWPRCRLWLPTAAQLAWCELIFCHFDILYCILLGGLRVDLIKWVSNVRPSTKSFFDFNEMWYSGRGQWVTLVGMQYDPIQGQGHEPLKVEKLAIFDGYVIPLL